MRKLLLLAAILGTSALWLQAQEGHPGKDTGQAVPNGQQTTIQGCLQSVGGYYTVRDDNGISHRLSGDTRELEDYVGHEVQLTGRHSRPATDTTMQGAASTATPRADFDVKNVRDISDNCTGR